MQCEQQGMATGAALHSQLVYANGLSIWRIVLYACMHVRQRDIVRKIMGDPS